MPASGHRQLRQVSFQRVADNFYLHVDGPKLTAQRRHIVIHSAIETSKTVNDIGSQLTSFTVEICIHNCWPPTQSYNCQDDQANTTRRRILHVNDNVWNTIFTVE